MSSYNETIDVIIPVYNEEEILPVFHQRITALSLPLNLIYIDNCSTDRSVEIIRSFKKVTLVEHEQNEGYGGSILDGIEKSSNERIVIIDADCEYPPEALPAILKRLNSCQVVYASRFLDGRNDGMPTLKRLGNQLISKVFNLFYQQQTTDLYTGCKAFHRSVLQEMNLTCTGYEHVLEFGVKVSRKNIPIQEVPVDFTPRHTGKAKMKHVSETLKCLYFICYYYFKRS